jgi:diacylglycerol kinase family enzyme
VNRRAGDASPTAAELAAEARRLGIEARELGAGEDAISAAEEAMRRGATALGIAGGDGSLGGIASVALAADLPFVPVPFGTRNHFARDVGFDPADPLAALAAFAGSERRVDVGVVSGRLFLNNVSLGLYASLVHDPRRDTKNRLVAALRMLPAAFGRSRRPLDLLFEIEGRRERRRTLLCLVANNGYTLTAERPRLDEGLLHAYVIEAASRRTLLRLLARAVLGRLGETGGWTEWTARAFRLESRRTRVHAAVDGEPLVLRPPLDFELRPRALRVLVPPHSRDSHDSPERRP